MEVQQVRLFELDADEDVTCRRQRENEVRDGHRGRRPESEDEAEVEGMADVVVKSGRLKAHRPVFQPFQMQIDLPEPKEIEVVDQEGADQYDPTYTSYDDVSVQ